MNVDFQLVTVIIPTYNRERTIKRSVESVLNQTHKNIELIIVDDGSTDGTQRIISEIIDSRIKVIINKENFGACKSRNIGISHAKGDFIAFQDSDDYWHNDKLEIQLKDMFENKADIVFCNMRSVETKNQFIFPKEPLNPYDPLYEQFLLTNRAGTQTLLFSNKCFKNDMFDESMPRFQEWELMIRLSKKFKIFHTNQVLVDYHLQNDSISKDFNKGLIAIKKIFNKNYESITSNKKIHHRYLTTISQYEIATKNKASKTMLKALKIKFEFKLFIKYLLTIFGLTFLIRARWKNEK